MDPKIWGPFMWRSIHYMAATANTQKKRDAFYDVLIRLQDCLPCDICASNLTKHLAELKYKDYCDNAERVLYYTYLLHDKVNKMLSVSNPEAVKVSPSFEDVRKMYMPVTLAHTAKATPKASVTKATNDKQGPARSPQSFSIPKAKIGAGPSPIEPQGERKVTFTAKERKLYRMPNQEPKFTAYHEREPVQPDVRFSVKEAQVTNPRTEADGNDYHMSAYQERLRFATKRLSMENNVKFVGKS